MWMLQDAKARFSEVVRRAKSDGPQVVTVHGREEVVVLSADDYRRLKGEPTGQALVDALRGSLPEDIEIEFQGVREPVRKLGL